MLYSYCGIIAQSLLQAFLIYTDKTHLAVLLDLTRITDSYIPSDRVKCEKLVRIKLFQGRSVAGDGEDEGRNDEQATDNAGLPRRQRQLQLRLEQGHPSHRSSPRAQR